MTLLPLTLGVNLELNKGTPPSSSSSSSSSSSPSALKTAETYNRHAQMDIYRKNNAIDPKKILPLRITLVKKEDQAALLKTLNVWVDDMLDNLIASKRKPELLAERNAITDCYTMTQGVMAQIFPESTKTVKIVEDESGVLHGISIVCHTKTTCKIDYLVSSPFNFQGSIYKDGTVKGAATALIEDAIFESLAIQNNVESNQPVPINALIGSRVILDSYSEISDNFYKNVYFDNLSKLEYDSVGRAHKILTGENVLKFLNRFGGRAFFDLSMNTSTVTLSTSSSSSTSSSTSLSSVPSTLTSTTPP